MIHGSAFHSLIYESSVMLAWRHALFFSAGFNCLNFRCILIIISTLIICEHASVQLNFMSESSLKGFFCKQFSNIVQAIYQLGYIFKKIWCLAFHLTFKVPIWTMHYRLSIHPFILSLSYNQRYAFGSI